MIWVGQVNGDIIIKFARRRQNQEISVKIFENNSEKGDSGGAQRRAKTADQGC